MPGELASRLEPVVAEVVAAAGFDLDAIEVAPAGRRKMVKVVVDGENGVGLDEVADLSRRVADVLDGHAHLIEGAYTLEVTSPGVDRPLTRPRHWRRARHRLARITPHEGAPFLARVGAVGAESVRVLADGALREVRFDSVAGAVIEVEFKPPPAAELELLGQEDEQETGETKGDRR